VLVPPSVFAEIATELKAIVGVPPTGAYKEEGAGRPRELVRLLDSPDQVTALKSHPRLVLHEPDVEYEAELRFVQTHGTGPFEFGARVDEWGASRGLGRLGLVGHPGWEIGLDTRLTKCLLYGSRIIRFSPFHRL
jgi:hypothetical protein